jgi:hypothetical protein
MQFEKLPGEYPMRWFCRIPAQLKASVLFWLIGFAALSVTYPATITDADWTVMNGKGYYGTNPWNGMVRTIVYNKGCIYVGGCFSIAGDLSANGIAKWDGNRWSPLGSGIIIGGYTFTDVMALAIDSNGILYATAKADVHNSSGWNLATLVKWNGTEWKAIIAPFYLTCTGWAGLLACDNKGNLYVGGCGYTAIGGISANNIAKWDGSKWSALGAGTSKSVSSIAFDKNGDLYVGGQFDSAGGIIAYHLAKWDGNNWEAIDTIQKNQYDDISGLAFDDNEQLYASLINLNKAIIAKWNGIGWDTLSLNDDGYRWFSYLLFDKRGYLYAVVWNGGILRWDGSYWETIGTLWAYGMAIDNNGTLYAGGAFENIGGSYSEPLKRWVGGVMLGHIAKWDGNYWSPLDSKLNNAIYSVAYDNGSIYAGGAFTIMDSVPINHIAKWDGKSWLALGSGVSGTVTAIAADNKGNVYAVGFFNKASGIQAMHIAKWDGIQWNSLGSGLNKWGFNNALAVDKSGNVYAGGIFDTAGGIAVKHIAKWDGNKWSNLESGVCVSSGKIADISAFAFDGKGNLFVGGAFDSAGGMFAKNIAQWNGTSWSTLGRGTDDCVYALVADRLGNLYAGGRFTYAGGKPANHIAQWNGSNWSALSLGTDSVIYSLSLDSVGNLYAGGNFIFTGTDSVRFIAKWNGARWSKLGSGVSDVVTSLVASDSTLYVGGGFSYVGDKFSPFIAKVNIHSTPDVSVRPMPTFASSFAIGYRIVKSKLIVSSILPCDRIMLYSLSGRCVRQAEGVSRMDLSGLAPQPLFVQIFRGGKIVSRGMVMVQ